MVAVRKATGWLLLAFLVFYIVTQPHEVATIIMGIVHLLHRAANSLTEVIRGL